MYGKHNYFYIIVYYYANIRPSNTFIIITLLCIFSSDCVKQKSQGLYKRVAPKSILSSFWEQKHSRESNFMLIGCPAETQWMLFLRTNDVSSALRC